MTPLNRVAQIRRIVVLRHGEAALYATSDHERPLTDYGRSSLQASLPSLVAQLERLIIESRAGSRDKTGAARLEIRVSDALRTVETWQLLSPELEALCRRAPRWSVKLKVNPELYLASAARLYRELLELESELELELESKITSELETSSTMDVTLIYIGHNPGLSELLTDLVPLHHGAPRGPLAPGEFICLTSDGQHWSARSALD